MAGSYQQLVVPASKQHSGQYLKVKGKHGHIIDHSEKMFSMSYTKHFGTWTFKCCGARWVDDKKKVLCHWFMPVCSPVPVMISIHKHAVCYPPPGSCLCAYEITIMHLPIPRINISPLLKFASTRHILVPYDLSTPSGITCDLSSFYIHCSTLMGI